jgi:hypothetical protein
MTAVNACGEGITTKASGLIYLTPNVTQISVSKVFHQKNCPTESHSQKAPKYF